jgi:hypothetical protein
MLGSFQTLQIKVSNSSWSNPKKPFQRHQNQVLWFKDHKISKNQTKIKQIQKFKKSNQQQKDPSRTRPRDVKNQNQIIFNGNPKFLLAISFQPFYISENLTTERHLNHPSFYTDSTLLVQYHVDRLIRINRSFHMQSILILNTSRTCIPHFDSLWTLVVWIPCLVHPSCSS